MRRITWIVLFEVCFISDSFSQRPDSLIYQQVVTRLQKSASDTNKIKLLWEAGGLSCILAEFPQKSFTNNIPVNYYRQAILLSDSLKQLPFIIESRCRLGDVLIKNDYITEGQNMFASAIKLSMLAQNKEMEADCWLRYGKGFIINYSHFFVAMINDSFYNEMTDCFRKSLELYQGLDKKNKECEVLIHLGDFQLKKGQLDNAGQSYQRALDLQTKYKLPQTENPYSGLLVTNYFKGNFNTALLHGLKAIKNAEEHGQTIDIDEIYFYVGNVYRDLNQHGKAIETYKRSLSEVYKKVNSNPIHYAYILKNVIREFITENKPDSAFKILKDNEKYIPVSDNIIAMLMTENNGQVYQALKQYDKAESYYKEMINIAERLRDPVRALPSYYTMGIFYFQIGQYEKAYQYLQKLSSSTRGQIPVSVLSDVFRMLYKIDSARGNYFESLKYFGEFKRMNDDIFNEKKNKQIEELQIQYETEKKDRDLKSRADDIRALTKEGELQKEKLSQSEKIRNLTIIGLLLLIVSIALLYSRYLVKQKSNERLELKQKEINGQNEQLHLLLKEKEWLLKEIHHRVKNNLQIVMSLLNSQSKFLKDDAAVKAIRDSQQRVSSMALIHQKLYQSDNLASIEMSEYIQEMVSYLKDSYGTGNNIDFEQSIASLKLELSQAVPLGLILNEAIANAIKYAFAAQQGRINVSLKNLKGNRFRLVIADNGIGLPANFDAKKIRSLGISLMQGLSEDIDAEFSIYSDNGTTIVVDFVAETSSMEGLSNETKAI